MPRDMGSMENCERCGAWVGLVPVNREPGLHTIAHLKDGQDLKVCFSCYEWYEHKGLLRD